MRMAAVSISLLAAAAASMSLSSCGGGAKEAPGAPVGSIADLKGGRVAVAVGTTHDQYLAAEHPDIAAVHVEDHADLPLMVLAGKAQAALGDALFLREVAKGDARLRVLDQELFSEPFGFGFADAATRDDFNAYLARLRESGRLQEMTRKWEGDYENAPMPAAAADAPSVELVMCCSPEIPFVFERSGRMVGLEIELAAGFAAWKGVGLRIELCPFAAMIAGVAAGRYDMLCGAVTITEERARQIHFADSHYASSALLMVADAPSAASAGRRRIGVLNGSAQDFLAAERYPEADLQRYIEADQLVTALLQGACDAIVLDDQLVAAPRQRYPQITPLEEGLGSSEIGFLAPRHRQGLVDSLDVFLDRLRATGELQAVVERWRLAPDARMPHIAVDGRNGRLRMGVMATSPPFAMMADNRPAGFLVELAERFAAWAGLEPVYDVHNFDGLLTAAATGKIDLAVGSIMATDERRAKFAFSAPVCTTSTALYGLAPTPTAQAGLWETVKEGFYNNLVKDNRYKLILKGLRVTVIIALISLLLGTALGGLVCWARMCRRRWLNAAAALYIELLRGIPQVVLLMIMFYVVFGTSGLSGVAVSCVTFALNFAAYSAEMFRTAIEGVDRGQTEAGVAMGFGRARTFALIVAPQAIRRVLPVYKGEAISLVKMTSIVGYIAVQDLTKAGDIIRSRTFDAFFPLLFVAAVYFVLAWLVGKCIGLAGRRFER